MSGWLHGIAGLVLAAQAPQAIIAGTVRSAASGAPLAGAVVVLADLDRAVTTDDDGRYVVRSVPPGPHHISVRMIGYAPRTLHALVPSEGRLEIDIVLTPQPRRLRAVEVRAPIAVRGMETEDSSALPDRGLTMAAVRNHPLLAESDVFEALGGGEVVLAPEAPSGMHLRGGGADHTAYVIDGIPVLSAHHAGGVFSAWNADALSHVRLSAAPPPLAAPHALSGVVEATTRAPGSSIRARGGVSTTQGRLTLDGPLGQRGAGWLVSARSGLPAALAPPSDASYLRGETGDWLAKVETPVRSGRLRMLGYGSENDMHGASVVSLGEGPAPAPPLNVFEWKSWSVGAEWRSTVMRTAGVRVVAWHAEAAADARWAARAGAVQMRAARRDDGVLATVTRGEADARAIAGVRLERLTTTYRVRSATVAALSTTFDASTPIATLLAQRTIPVGARAGVEAGGSLAIAAGSVHPAPRVSVRWRASESLTFSSGYVRSYQFAQSLRNGESVVGAVFPPELYVGAGGTGAPVTRSDQAVLAADYRGPGGVRVSVQGYERAMHHLLLVAPRGGEPFAIGGFTTGAGSARGVSLETAASGSRGAIVASYGMQRVRLAYGDTTYVPSYGASHHVEAGVIVFPSASWSIRAGVTGIAGRRATAVSGGFEWESCNLLDKGCEFAGSPHHDGEALGATALPAYLRLDAGIRRHWHVKLAGRDASIALFGTLTNLLSRKNLLTYARDESGALTPVELRPLAPLVVGLDWVF